MESEVRYPLHWPVTTLRTNPMQRESSPFGNRTVAAGVIELGKEMDRLDGRDWLISSNLRMRQDGLPMSGSGRVDDPGVAVYFTLKGKRLCLACDRYTDPAANIRAIVKHIDAMRGMQRWGVGSLEQAFAGYAALPPASRPWHEVLGVPPNANADQIKAAWREGVKVHHPDTGGDRRRFEEVQRAYEQAQAAV